MFESQRNDIKELKRENEELTKSLTFTQAELDEVRQVSKEQIDKLHHLTEPKGFTDLSNRLRKLEDYSRKNNVIIEGLPESKDETTEK